MMKEVIHMSDLSPDTSRHQESALKDKTTASRGKVLAVISSARNLTLTDGTTALCGYHLSELVEFHKELSNAGFGVVFATPDGDTPLADASDLASMTPEDRLNCQRYADALTELLIPYKLSDITEEMLHRLHGLLIPGGRSALVDLPEQKDLKRILKHMKHHMKPIVTIGHGAAGLIHSPDPEEQWLFYDYEMTCFPKALEERESKHLSTALPEFELQEVLDNLGAELRFHRHYTREFIVEFKELLTGQNSASTTTLAKLVICHLNQNLKTMSER